MKVSTDTWLSKLNKSAFYFAVFTFPLQLNKYYWPESAFVLGVPIDLLAQPVYLSDIFIIVFLTTFPITSYKSLFKFLSKNKAPFLALFTFALYYSITSVLNYSPTAVYKAIKVLEFTLFSVFSAKLLEDGKNYIGFLKTLFFASVCQLIVITLQFVNQGSIGLAFIGERPLNTSIPGLAKITLLGRDILRSYGTFPHPNVAAAFFLFTFITLASQKKIFQNQLTFMVTGLGIVLTFSKSVQLMFLISIIYLLKSLRVRVLILILSLIPLVFILIQLSTFQIASISERLSLIEASVEIANGAPIFGIGPGNFINKLSTLNIFSLREIRLLQPVHNIFLLILVENGFIGLFLLISIFVFLIPKLKQKRNIMLFTFLVITSTIDHFFLTLHQGMFIFFLALALILASPKLTSPDILLK